jgi:hypothetical protein
MSDIRVPYIEMRRARWFAAALAVTAIGLAGCGDDGEGSGTRAVPDVDRVSADRGGRSEEIRIKTRLSVPVGEVLSGAYIGDSEFCSGGRFRDQHGGSGAVGTVVKTFRCPNGRLTISFRPVGTESCARQGGSWRLVNGSGRFEGLRGHGRMNVEFTAPSKGRETFTGTVAR